MKENEKNKPMSFQGFTVKQASLLLHCTTDWVGKFCRMYKEKYNIQKFGGEWVVTPKIVEALRNSKGKRGRPKKIITGD